MNKFKLKALFEISGIGSASGLVYQNGQLYIISDNSTFLYQYTMQNAKLNSIKLIEKSGENLPKVIKPDFESITLKGNKLYIFGFGATVNRQMGISYNIKTKKINEKSLSYLNEKFRLKSGLSYDNLNLEGAFYVSKKWFFFQRGNGAASKNGIFIYAKNELDFIAIQLPKIKNIEATFTDAIVVDDLIYFLAAVENTISTYDDGEILGCFIGCLSLSTLEIIFTHKITDCNKFEGITLFKNSDNQIDFLLCEDNDTDISKTIIYNLSIKK